MHCSPVDFLRTQLSLLLSQTSAPESSLANTYGEILTDHLYFGNAELETTPEPETRTPMSPAIGDAAQTPESKSTSGFASVFKSLTGNKSLRSQNPHSPVSIAQHASGAHPLQPSIYGGPADYEYLYEQLKPDKPLADRISAAESLRLAVQDYPLSGVRVRRQDTNNS